MPNEVLQRDQIFAAVQHSVAQQPVVDLHTHLYGPGFGTPVGNAGGQVDPAGLMLWGIDELITYHYLIAEVYRVVPAKVLPYEQFFKLTKAQQAEHIWHQLFVARSPLSEACRGVLTTLQKLGLDPNEKTLEPYRRFFEQQKPGEFIDRVMKIANVKSITMTNSVFDDAERTRWLNESAALVDSRFKSALRIDPLVLDYPLAAKKMSELGYVVGHELGPRTIDEAKKFLREWIDRMSAIYVAVSLPPDWRYPIAAGDWAAEAGQKMLEKVILPVCGERGLPFAMMIGSRRGVNPGLRDAGDMGGRADIASLTNLLARFPDNKFLVTMLSRENQHDLCVAARKFGNLMIFGCWWFMNIPSMVEEIERMRFELLGSSFIPQHSDARVIDQLVYKWDHSRRVIGKVLAEKYVDMNGTGLRVTREQIGRDVQLLLEGNFKEFLSR